MSQCSEISIVTFMCKLDERDLKRHSSYVFYTHQPLGVHICKTASFPSPTRRNLFITRYLGVKPHHADHLRDLELSSNTAGAYPIRCCNNEFISQRHNEPNSSADIEHLMRPSRTTLHVADRSPLCKASSRVFRNKTAASLSTNVP